MNYIGIVIVPNRFYYGSLKEVGMKNWRTTVAGILAGAAQVIASGAMGWRAWIIGLATVALGALAKDAGNGGE